MSHKGKSLIEKLQEQAAKNLQEAREQHAAGTTRCAECPFATNNQCPFSKKPTMIERILCGKFIQYCSPEVENVSRDLAKQALLNLN